MDARITLREIAARAGVHLNTVGRALSRHRSISEPTQQRIQQLADEMGYVPDPMLSALNVYRQRVRPASFGGTLAWLTTSAKTSHSEFNAQILASAQSRAAKPGYSVEEYELDPIKVSSGRSSAILSARGISGLLLAPTKRPRGHFTLDSPKFSIVRLSDTVTHPNSHLVNFAQYRSMITIMRALQRLGYRRIGLVLYQSAHERVDRSWTAAYPVEQLRHEPRNRVPALIDIKCEISVVCRWYLDHDAIVITIDNKIADHLATIGVRVPDDVGLAVTSRYKETDCAGINENLPALGETGVDFLVGMLHRNERGLPQIPLAVTVDGTWVEGQSVRRQN